MYIILLLQTLVRQLFYEAYMLYRNKQLRFLSCLISS